MGPETTRHQTLSHLGDQCKVDPGEASRPKEIPVILPHFVNLFGTFPVVDELLEIWLRSGYFSVNRSSQCPT